MSFSYSLRTQFFALLAAFILLITASEGLAQQPPPTNLEQNPDKALVKSDGPASPETIKYSFEDRLDQLFGHINSYIATALFFSVTGGEYEVPFVVAVLVIGSIFFSFWFGWINIRGFRHGIALVRGKYDNPEDVGEISHFRALTSALSATVGLGNIAGVALAVTIGGPGAVFWMMVLAVFGMSVKFSSCTLAQLFRKTNEDGSISGGPMYYLDLGLKQKGPSWAVLGKILAVMFAIMCIGGALGGGNMFQANQSFEAFAEAANLDLQSIDAESGRTIANPWPARVYGVVMASLVGVVILGGIKRIGAATSRIVPLMCLTYVIASLVIIASHVQEVPGLIALIVREALSTQAAYGGFIGVMVWGFKRAAFSNEAGLGSAAIAHSAAKTNEPVREGLVAMLGPFIDTIVICFMTSLVVLITGAYVAPSLVLGDRPELIRQAVVSAVAIDPASSGKGSNDRAIVRFDGGATDGFEKGVDLVVSRRDASNVMAVISQVEGSESVGVVNLEEELRDDGLSHSPKRYANLPKAGDLVASGRNLNSELPGVLIQGRVTRVEQSEHHILAQLDIGFDHGVVRQMILYVHQRGTFHGTLVVTDVQADQCEAVTTLDLGPTVGDLAVTARATKKGAAVTMLAFRSLADWFPLLLSACIILFAFSTMISWCYYGERACIYLLGHRSLTFFRLIFVVFVFLGSVMPLGNVLDFSDLMILCMAFPNIVGSVILAPYVKQKVDDYWRRYKSGEMQSQ